jgi:chromosome partitioning protein
MHIIVSLLKSGQRVASFDLDLNQKSLTRYIENRRDWAQQSGRNLELPEHRYFPPESRRGGAAGEQREFCESLAAVQKNFDYLVIDTPGAEDRLTLLAHGMADTLVTPINDSFVDLDVIASVSPFGDAPAEPSWYAVNVSTAMAGRTKVGGQSTDWIVVRNRISPLPSRNNHQIAEVLDVLSSQLGFRIVAGISERLVYRELFPFGLTAFDPFETRLLGFRNSVAQAKARSEIRHVVDALHLPMSRGMADAHAELDASSTPDPKLHPQRKVRQDRQLSAGYK